MIFAPLQKWLADYTLSREGKIAFSGPGGLDFFLKSGELKNAFSNFEILFYDEGDHNDRATAQLLAKKL